MMNQQYHYMGLLFAWYIIQLYELVKALIDQLNPDKKVHSNSVRSTRIKDNSLTREPLLHEPTWENLIKIVGLLFLDGVIREIRK